MFEKEAEEIEKEAIKWVKDVFPNDEFKQSGISRALVEFAELGYNKANEWHNIEDKHDLPWEEGVYEFRDKDGEIEEVCILWDDNDDCNIGWEYYDAWRNLTTKELEK